MRLIKSQDWQTPVDKVETNLWDSAGTAPHPVANATVTLESITAHNMMSLDFAKAWWVKG